jgi:hypothetical protein
MKVSPPGIRTAGGAQPDVFSSWAQDGLPQDYFLWVAFLHLASS